jgi:hypothetical protein
MKLLVGSIARSINDASNLGAWQLPAGFEIVEVAGDAETYAWPNGAPTRCKLDGSNAVIADPAWVRPPSGRDFLRAAVLQLDGATNAAKLDRCSALMVSDAAWAGIVQVLNSYETLMPADNALIRRLWARKTQLSAGEVSRVEALAGGFGVTLP